MRKIVTSKALLAPLGVSVAAITISIWLASQLPPDTWPLVIGLTIGLIIGIPVGMISIMLAIYYAQPPLSSSLPFDAQLPSAPSRLTQHQHLSGVDANSPTRTERQFSAVGGADVMGDADSDTDSYSP